MSGSKCVTLSAIVSQEPGSDPVQLFPSCEAGDCPLDIVAELMVSEGGRVRRGCGEEITREPAGCRQWHTAYIGVFEQAATDTGRWVMKERPIGQQIRM